MKDISKCHNNLFLTSDIILGNSSPPIKKKSTRKTISILCLSNLFTRLLYIVLQMNTEHFRKVSKHCINTCWINCKKESIRSDNERPLVTITRIFYYESKNAGLQWGNEWMGNENSLWFYKVLLYISRISFPTGFDFLSPMQGHHSDFFILLTYYLYV